MTSRLASELEDAPLDDEEEPVWNPYPDPREENARLLRPTGNSVKRIRDLEEITVNPSEYRVLSTEGLKTLEFTAPRRFEHALCFTERLVTLTEFCKRETDGLDSTTIRELNRVRRDLIASFAAEPTSIFYEKQSYMLNYTDYSDSLSLQAFIGLLWCVRKLSSDASFQRSMGNVTGQHAAMQELVEHKIIPDELIPLKLAELDLHHLLWAIQALELRWNIIQPFRSLGLYLDLLLVSCSRYVAGTQSSAEFGRLTEYYMETADGICEATTLFYEDFSWSLMPMYQRLALHSSLHTDLLSATIVFTKEQRRQLQRRLCEETRKLADNTLESMFLQACTKSLLRPSEMNRYRRKCPGEDTTAASILRAMRPPEACEQIFTDLSNMPSFIIENKMFFRPEREVLITLMLQVAISNLVVGELSWLNTFVHFRTELMENSDALEFVDREYPVIVQHFNSFGVYWKKRLLPTKHILEAFVHWLNMMMGPPFKGSYKNISLHSLKSLLKVNV